MIENFQNADLFIRGFPTFVIYIKVPRPRAFCPITIQITDFGL